MTMAEIVSVRKLDANESTDARPRNAPTQLVDPVKRLMSQQEPLGAWLSQVPLRLLDDKSVIATFVGFQGDREKPVPISYRFQWGGLDEAQEAFECELNPECDRDSALVLIALAYVQSKALEGAASRVARRGLTLYSQTNPSVNGIKEREPFLDAVLEISQVLWWEVGSSCADLQGLYEEAQNRFHSRKWREQTLEEVQLLQVHREWARNTVEREQAQRLNTILLALTIVTIVTGIVAIFVAIVLVTPTLIYTAWIAFGVALVASVGAFVFRREIYRKSIAWGRVSKNS